MQAVTLQPGVLDGSAKHAFRHGACTVLAIAFHDVMGWPIIAIIDSHNVDEGSAGGGSSLHYAARRPDGRLVDIDGAHEPEELLNEYHDEADDGGAALGISCRADTIEWYVECQGEPVSLALARSFVGPVHALCAEQDLAAADAGAEREGQAP